MLRVFASALMLLSVALLYGASPTRSHLSARVARLPVLARVAGSMFALVSTWLSVSADGLAAGVLLALTAFLTFASVLSLLAPSYPRSVLTVALLAPSSALLACWALGGFHGP